MSGKKLFFESYKRLNEIDWNLQRPNVNLDDLDLVARTEWVYDYGNNTITQRDVVGSPGLYHTIREILGNAADAISNARKNDVDPGHLELAMDETTITVKSYGMGIGIYRDDNSKDGDNTGKWWPELLFFHLRTSSNYDDKVEKVKIGQNGIGSKIVTIFSKSVSIRIVDESRGLCYEQCVMNNMRSIGEPVITECTDEPSSVQYSYELDFARFGIEHYSQDHLELFARYALETAVDSDVDLYLNGVHIPQMRLDEFVKLFFPNDNPSMLYHNDPEHRIKYCLVDTPSKAITMGYVYGIHTLNGGAHVKGVTEKVLQCLTEAGLIVLKSRDAKKDAQNEAPKLDANDVLSAMSVFVMFRGLSPKFTGGQAKLTLKSPKPTVVLPENAAAMFRRWNSLQYLNNLLEAKDRLRLKITDGKKERNLGEYSKNVDDANFAGTAKSHMATLIPTEGVSANKYANKLIDFLGRDLFGRVSLRGKLLNVTNAGTTQIEHNNEIIILKKALGLREGVDYSLDENFNTLRYGKLLIATDADDDGAHIRSLIVNYLYEFYPTLIQRGFVYIWESPQIRIDVSDGSQLAFYRECEFENWLQEHNGVVPTGHTVRYLKGLASNTDEDVRFDHSAFKAIILELDENSQEAMSMAFNEHFIDARKQWITEWDKIPVPSPEERQTVSELIYNDLITYSVRTLSRAIPRFDSFKDSQRKIIWTVLQTLGYNKKTMKVSRLGATVAEKTHYHHGETMLGDTISRMMLDFTGTNNLPLLHRHGQVGDRDSNTVSAGRYIETKGNWCLNYLFPKDDFPLLDYNYEEGEQVEPKFLIPIIALALINGTDGIATGWSTKTPKFHPLDVLECTRCLLLEKPMPLITPWYRGFKGDIELRTNSEGDVNGFICRGRFEVKGSNRYGYKVDITEIPILRTYSNYRKFLDGLISVKSEDNKKKEKQLTNYTRTGKSNDIVFHLDGLRFEPTYTSLQLERSFSYANMTFLGIDDKPVRFNNPEDIIKAHFDIRWDYYVKRLEYQCQLLRDEIIKIKEKIRYVTLIRDKTLVLDDPNIEEVLQQHGFPETILNVTTKSQTMKGFEQLQKGLQKLYEKLEVAEQLSPKEVWLKELDAFEKAYKSHYHKDR